MSVFTAVNSSFQDTELIPYRQSEQEFVRLFSVLKVAGVACLIVKTFGHIDRCLFDIRVVHVRSLVYDNALFCIVIFESGFCDSERVFDIIEPDKELFDGQANLVDRTTADQNRYESTDFAAAGRDTVVFDGVLF